MCPNCATVIAGAAGSATPVCAWPSATPSISTK
uniref:Uncharacterized protein n=1 Tax=Romanomermis culicivorax TaxID=13658 RepID=A0A915HTG9_ROMCU